MKKRSFYKWLKKRIKHQYHSLRELYAIESSNSNVHIENGVQIINSKNLRLGKNIYICRGSVLHCGGEAWCNFQGGISIGDYTYIAPNCVLFGAGEIEIGAQCNFGPGVQIMSQSLHKDLRNDDVLLDKVVPPHMFAKVTLGKGVLVGTGSIILAGVTIGDGAVISAGSVIQKDIPKNSVVITGRKIKVIDKQSPLFRPR